MIGVTRRLAIGALRAQVRHESSAARHRLQMYDALRKHYTHLGDTEEYSAELARQHIRWLIEGAKARATRGEAPWEDLAQTMVMDELIAKNKPLAYVLGDAPFHPLPSPLLVRAPTLIPRPETEEWTAHIASRLAAHLARCPASARPFRVLDIGTGTGCIPLAIAFGLGTASTPCIRAIELEGVDVAPSAVELARENVERLSPLLPQSTRASISIRRADVFEPNFTEQVTTEGGFDLIISNPPYIRPEDFDALEPSVREWEDRGALVGEREVRSECASAKHDPTEADTQQGLVFYRQIIALSSRLLRTPSHDHVVDDAAAPAIVFEVGMGQAEAVSDMLEEAGYVGEIRQDHWSVNRCVIGTRAGSN